MPLKFFKDSHKYVMDGLKIPSVTQIIRFANAETDYSNVPEWILKRAAEIGDLTHGTIENYYAKYGNLITDDKSVAAYLDGFVKFEAEHTFAPLHCEVMYACECHRFAGTIDLIGSLDGVPCILDIKTTNKINLEYVELQTAAYKHLAETFLPAETFSETFLARKILHLTKRGTFKVIDCVDEDAWPTFENFVKLYWEENSNA